MAEQKKSSKADLQNKRLLFREIGLLVALLLVIALFSIGKREQSSPQENFTSVQEEIEGVIVEELPPPPPVQEEESVSDRLEVSVDDDPLPTIFDSDFDFNDLVGNSPFEEEELLSELDIPLNPIAQNDITPPAFVGGGPEKFVRFLRSRTLYPVAVQRGKISGVVTVEFVVATDGSMKDIRIKSESHRLLNVEVLRAMRTAPAWTPAKKNGRPIPVTCSVDIHFIL